MFDMLLPLLGEQHLRGKHMIRQGKDLGFEDILRLHTHISSPFLVKTLFDGYEHFLGAWRF